MIDHRITRPFESEIAPDDFPTGRPAVSSASHISPFPISERSLDGGTNGPLVSAADFHNRDVRRRQIERSATHTPTGAAVDFSSGPPHVTRTVERQSWMDAQSVERARLEEEYENESCIYATKGWPGQCATEDAKMSNVESEQLGEMASEMMKEKETKKRSKKRDHKNRHADHHGHRKQNHKDKDHVLQPRGDNVKAENNAKATFNPTPMRSSTGTTEGHRNDGVEEIKPSPKEIPSQSDRNAPPMPSVPWDSSNNMTAFGFPPMFFPPVSPFGQYPPPQPTSEQQLQQPPGMQMQDFPWGLQAHHPNAPPRPDSDKGNGDLAFKIPYYGQYSDKPLPKQGDVREPHPNPNIYNRGIPPVPHSGTCSPRTLPPDARFPFPPWGQSEPNAVSPVQRQELRSPRSGRFDHTHPHVAPGYSAVSSGVHDSQWPMSVPSQTGGIPLEFNLPPGSMYTGAEPLPTVGTAATEDHAHPRDTALKFDKHGSRSASSVPTEQADSNEADQELARLREQMKKNAEDSRKAIKEEKKSGDPHEQRLAALAILAHSTPKGEKQRNGGNSDRSKAQTKKSKDKAAKDVDPTYVETSEGFIKTYERGEGVPDVQESNSTSPGSTRASLGKPPARRMTQRTQKTLETQPTFTSGPSFGHFGRPFSHEFDGATPDSYTAGVIDSFPVDPARIVIMQRTVAANPGFGVPVSALGGFGLGMGIFSSFEDTTENSQRGEHSIKRSAYVETVSDEEDPRIVNAASHSLQRGLPSVTAEKVYDARSEQEQVKQAVASSFAGPELMIRSAVLSLPFLADHDNQQELSVKQGDDTPKFLTASLQGSPIFKEVHNSSIAFTDHANSVPPPHPKRFSQALTTASLVDQLVQGSQHHDETLCQLLMAARDPKLGEAAKRAVRHAARKRVMRLMSEQPNNAHSTGSTPTFKGKDKPLPAQPKNREEDEAPLWSQPLFEMLAETQTRLNELDARLPYVATREVTDSLSPEDDFAETQARAALHNLLFPDLPMEVPFFVDQYGNPHTSHHLGSSRNHVDTREIRGRGTSTDTGFGAKVETLFTDGHSSESTAREGDRETESVGAKGVIPEGVPLSDSADRQNGKPTFIPPVVRPKVKQDMPTIHIQSPTTNTTSTAGAQRSRNAPSPAFSRMRQNSKHDQLHDVAELSQENPLHGGESGPDGRASPVNIPVHRSQDIQSHEQMRTDALMQHIQRSRPWNIVTQRLFAWALVWPAEDFYRSLKTIALGQQYLLSPAINWLVSPWPLAMPLRALNIFGSFQMVPPNMLILGQTVSPISLQSDAINRAVHAVRMVWEKNDLAMHSRSWKICGIVSGGVLDYLKSMVFAEDRATPKTAFSFEEPPRVIVALAKHRNDPDHWSAHRFDLMTGRLVTMTFSHEEKSLIDGRPFMWWHVIRQAWPQFNIPHPDHLAQQTRRVLTSEGAKHDNSLAAANAARNLLLGWKPERPTEMQKLRELVWQENKPVAEDY
ncbi:hypothetical protein QFC19_003602 [Naganishia cerealis]|uniref:Uncharacterized protein n=1 Tax=Naganishia cerealis TaxID=610337 RepID=A0ACC2W094_9TREE|nr:hypothetical protein QFC19_003602 [Naganishia cerealis]